MFDLGLSAFCEFAFYTYLDVFVYLECNTGGVLLTFVHDNKTVSLTIATNRENILSEPQAHHNPNTVSKGATNDVPSDTSWPITEW